ncbi:MAG: transaldolase [Hormoscilla sp. SP5CHS1]|nr:transaldolase [Hormoscilla sp. SP12CHS1]MBC6452850.1 transaldolase [Hormoscilla sp. SP5CHS1]
MATNHLLEISAYGQSIWMDNLTRDIIKSGELKQMTETGGIKGITSNPAIFEKAIEGNKIYDEEIEAGIRKDKSVLEIYESLVFDDIRDACDVFLPVYEATKGLDGYVSIEVPPTIAKNTETTISEARRYNQAIGRPNVMIKIPGTAEGLPAVEAAIADGINVNITLLFSVESYVQTARAYIRGLEKRVAAGKDISKIASVASFFLSRIDSNIDSKVDKMLAAATDEESKAKLLSIKGKVAIANAKIAYQEYKKIIQSDRWKALSAKGAQVQRLLWASTSTKNPEYSDVMYVDELVGPDTVNTLPPSTIVACTDHCDVDNRVENDVDSAYKLMETLKEENINLDEVMAELLEEGIDKFVKPFDTLMKSLEDKVKQLVPA